MATEIILENNLYTAKWNANHGKFWHKKSSLQTNKIGLWDVLKGRKGSLDVHIKNQTENDFEVCFGNFRDYQNSFQRQKAHYFRINWTNKGISYVMPSQVL
jgi:hypothetical protein